MVNKWIQDGLQSICSQSAVNLQYVGSRLRMDRELVESAGIRFKAIFSGKLRKYFDWRNFIDPFSVIIGFLQSFYIIIRFWPHIVFSKGGFVSLPVVFAAFILRRPIILHESDSVMGLANRLMSRLADRVCVSFPPDAVLNLIKRQDDNIVFTGNPIRQDIRDGKPEEGRALTGFHHGKPVLLVYGGSQGAQSINDIIVREFNRLKSVCRIIHITGRGKRTGIKDSSYIQYEYSGEDIKHIYAITDAVFGRAGANSLYELAFLKKPNILLPLSNPDQIGNAAYFEKQGASIILGKDESLFDALNALLRNPAKIAAMKEALGRIAKPDAPERIAKIIFKFILPREKIKFCK